jgi:hypothetical protein
MPVTKPDLIDAILEEAGKDIAAKVKAHPDYDAIVSALVDASINELKALVVA